jgi:hypothetical protein
MALIGGRKEQRHHPPIASGGRYVRLISHKGGIVTSRGQIRILCHRRGGRRQSSPDECILVFLPQARRGRPR